MGNDKGDELSGFSISSIFNFVARHKDPLRPDSPRRSRWFALELYHGNCANCHRIEVTSISPKSLQQKATTSSLTVTNP